MPIRGKCTESHRDLFIWAWGGGGVGVVGVYKLDNSYMKIRRVLAKLVCSKNIFGKTTCLNSTGQIFLYFNYLSFIRRT